MNKIKNFSFTKNRKVFFIIAACVFVIGIASFIIRGFNFDTDFVGGTTLQFNMGRSVDSALTSELQTLVETTSGVKVSSIRRAGSDDTNVIIKTLEMDTETRAAVAAAICDAYSLPEDALLSSENVGASVSREFRNSAIMATAIAVVLMLVYITVRFSFRSGIAAVLCLIHDLFVMLTVYSLFQIPMDSNVIAAFLTILGYSINATIIVFDRIRDNNRKYQKESFADNADKSIHQTLARSINTTLTTLFTIGMIFIFGVESIRNFAFPLIIGIFAGLFSSVCLSGSIWCGLREIIPSKKK